MKSERERTDELTTQDIRVSRIPSPDVCRRLLSLDSLDTLRNAVTSADLAPTIYHDVLLSRVQNRLRLCKPGAHRESASVSPDASTGT
jgi:hypothetical protein